MGVQKKLFIYVCLLTIVVHAMAAPYVSLLKPDDSVKQHFASISEAVDHDELLDIFRSTIDHIQIVTENFNFSSDFFIISRYEALHTLHQRLYETLLSVQNSIELRFTVSDIIFPFSYFW